MEKKIYIEELPIFYPNNMVDKIKMFENYEIEVVPNEEADTLVNPTKKYKTKHKDGTDVST